MVPRVDSFLSGGELEVLQLGGFVPEPAWLGSFSGFDLGSPNSPASSSCPSCPREPLGLNTKVYFLYNSPWLGTAVLSLRPCTPPCDLHMSPAFGTPTDLPVRTPTLHLWPVCPDASFCLAHLLCIYCGFSTGWISSSCTL